MSQTDFLRLRSPRSRRDFFRLAGLSAAGGTAVVFAACGDDEDEPAGTDGMGDSGATADDDRFDTRRLTTGESGELRFDKPGTYSYYCVFHPFMTGRVEVKE